MPRSQSAFGLVDKIFLSLGLLLGLFVATVTLFFDRSGSFNILFYPLLPGLIAHLLITGGHGGTTAQETIAPWIAGGVNGVFYFGIVVIASSSGED